MVLVIRVRPRQIERFVFISIIGLLIFSNLYLFFLWKPDNSCVSVVDTDILKQENDSLLSETTDSEDYEVLNITELESEVESDPEPKEEPKEEEEQMVESDPEPKEEPKEEEEEQTGIHTGKVTFNIDSLTWNVDPDKDDFGHLERISFTIENGLDVDLIDLKFKIYVYDSNDPLEMKNSYYTLDLSELGVEVPANERWIDSQYSWNPNTKQGMSGFVDTDLQKTVKIVLKDDAAGVEVTDIVKETPSD